MQTDVLVLNFAVVDFRRNDFHFVSELVSHGGIDWSQKDAVTKRITDKTVNRRWMDHIRKENVE